jgi:tRNA(Ile)-lysidine synthase TilS/MesJ
MSEASKNGPLFHQMRYCVRCCLPETEEGTSFDELGICQACQNSEQKMRIDWAERRRQLEAIFDEAKAGAGNGYDCLLPISGGKDSTFQMYVLTQVFGMKPLAVTFNHSWYSETGWYNLVNSLERFNVDHIMFTPNAPW